MERCLKRYGVDECTVMIGNDSEGLRLLQVLNKNKRKKANAAKKTKQGQSGCMATQSCWLYCDIL
jgi:hypothetical protein